MPDVQVNYSPKTQSDWRHLSFDAKTYFTPAAPINEKDLFAGREAEIRKMLDATFERGKHVVLFGERGVGKTSLSSLFAGFFAPNLQSFRVIRTQADPSDDFFSIWKKVFREIEVKLLREGQEISETLDSIYAETISPDDVRRELDLNFNANDIPIIIIDEFDKIGDKPHSTELMANTIKGLSDFSVNVTLILVGVADSIVELIGEHESLGRCLEQVLMPRMTLSERREILDKILPRLNMTIDEDAKWKIVDLSRGLPTYVHSLGMYSAENAISRQSLKIEISDVDDSIMRVLDKSQESIQEKYALATHSNRSTLYEQVLLACAMAETNDRGFFTPQSVCEPLSRILDKDIEIQIATFQQHLKAFITEERGQILERKGKERAYQFRFEDPLMQPFVIMNGISKGYTDTDSLSNLSPPSQGSLPV